MTKKRILSLFVLIIFLFGIAIYTADSDTSKRAYFKVKNQNGKFLVKNILSHELKDNIVSVESSKRSIDLLKKNKNLEYLGDVPIYEVLSIKQNDYGLQTEDYLSSVNGTSSSLGRVCKLSDYNLPQINYGIKYMYADLNLVKTDGGTGVKVAVLDTGANISHPDITNRVRYCKDFNGPVPSNNCDDTASNAGGHGTPIASVIAADSGSDNLGMYGIAPGAELYIIKVCNLNSCSEDSIISGLYDAINQNVNIISMSFGISNQGISQVMKEALDRAYDHNILLIAGAGNYFGPINIDTMVYPAAYYKVISVGAINPDYSVWPNSARGINDGDYKREEREIEFGAPGTGIVSASKTGCYTNEGGTSMTAPHIAGLAAKLWDGNAYTTRIKLQGSARLHDLNTPGDDTATGFGLPTIYTNHRNPIFTYIE